MPSWRCSVRPWRTRMTRSARFRAALDMQAGAVELSADWAGKLGQAVKLHIGIHTGPVVAGNLGEAAAAAYAVTGDTVNTTARLLAAASGSMLVSDATYALTQHRFAFEVTAGVDAARQGGADAVSIVWSGGCEEPRTARGLAAHGLSTAMVGRGDELASVARCLRAHAAWPGAVREPCGRGGYRQDAADRRVHEPARGRRAARAHRRPPCRLLVAWPADLRHFRRPLPGSL